MYSWQRYIRKDNHDYFRRRAEHRSEFINAMAEWVRTDRQIEQRLRAIGKGRREKIGIRRGKKHRKPRA